MLPDITRRPALHRLQWRNSLILEMSRTLACPLEAATLFYATRLDEAGLCYASRLSPGATSQVLCNVENVAAHVRRAMQHGTR